MKLILNPNSIITFTENLRFLRHIHIKLEDTLIFMIFSNEATLYLVCTMHFLTHVKAGNFKQKLPPHGIVFKSEVFL